MRGRDVKGKRKLVLKGKIKEEEEEERRGKYSKGTLREGVL